MRTRKLAGAGLMGLLSAACVHSPTQTPADLHARTLAAMCAACHGSEGRSSASASIPSLAGLPRDYMREQLQDFRNADRPATVMHQIAKGLNEEQIEALSDYFSRLPR